ncbi:hypothetical protein V1525DRAFT_286796 [Lipomyces kononenkoae]|uniref:Uncharacterized protein n=1 Tax=Lipomyces kononenkoae TaxID=34357 RepID=A0ACC3SWB5_LIPKO
MATEEEIRYQRMRELIQANDPDNEYEFEISSTRYDQLKHDLGKDDENEKYPRLLYDWTRQVITIVTVPTDLHEDTSQAILTSVFLRTQSLLERQGIRLGTGQILGCSGSPRRLIDDGHSGYEMEPDGVIFFETLDAREFKVVIEVGVSHSNDSLLEKARKWLYDHQCKVVLLLAFNEQERYCAPRGRISLTKRQKNDQVVGMRRRWLSPSFTQFGPLEFRGHVWLKEISEAFVEVVRKDPDSDRAHALTSMKYILIENGRDESSSVPTSVGDIRLGELIPLELLESTAAASMVVDFFNSDSFMDTVRRAMVNTAISRFEKAVRRIA